MGVQAPYSPDGQRLALNRKSQVYWRKYNRGAYQSDVMVMDSLFGPKVVLQNWRSASNAEMFPEGFRAGSVKWSARPRWAR